jgi:hypothetical protein
VLIVLIGCGVSYRFVEQKSVFLFHCRLTPVGDPPSPRAAHAATAVGTMVVIQGGIGPAGLSTDDLHVLDLTQTKPRWHRWVYCITCVECNLLVL